MLLPFMKLSVVMCISPLKDAKLVDIIVWWRTTQTQDCGGRGLVLLMLIVNSVFIRVDNIQSHTHNCCRAQSPHKRERQLTDTIPNLTQKRTSTDRALKRERH